MIITISGTPGSGKSAVAKYIAEELNLKRYYMGQMFRDLAKGKGLSLRQYLETGESNPQVDKDIDDYQKNLGKTEDNFIIEGRTSFLMIPKSIKILLTASLEEGAKRIYLDLQQENQRNEGHLKTASEVREEIGKRMATDRKRYMKYYHTDVFDPKHYDIVLDTTTHSLAEVKDYILEAIRQKMSQSSP